MAYQLQTHSTAETVKAYLISPLKCRAFIAHIAGRNTSRLPAMDKNNLALYFAFLDNFSSQWIKWSTECKR